MNTAEKENLYQLIRDYSHTQGASMATIRALKSYRAAVGQLKCSAKEFPVLFREINDLIRETEPRIVPLVHLLERLDAGISPHFDLPVTELKELTIIQIDELIAHFKHQIDGVIKKGVELISQGDFIIAHTPSMEVMGIFESARSELALSFKVLVVEQDFIRIRNLIQSLEKEDIEHVVIPETNLSHYMEQLNKLFLGAVSITSDKKVVTTAGSANVAALCRHYRIPSYLFTCSLKFAHKSAVDQNIPNRKRMVDLNDRSYPVTTYSHDIVDLALIDHVITE